VLLDYRPLPSSGSVPVDPGFLRPLDRQAVLFGLTQVKVSMCPSRARRREVHRFSVAVGAVSLCRVGRADEICVIDFGTDLDSWTLTFSASVIDHGSGEVVERRLFVSTLDAALDEGVIQKPAADDPVVREERVEAQSVPYDEVTRIALVLAGDRSPVPGLAHDDFDVNVTGVRGEQLVGVTPMRAVVEPRLLFVLIDVADFIRDTRTGPEWRTTYRPFVEELVRSLAEVGAPGRELLVVRYSSAADASPVVELNEDGLASVETWLLRPPLGSWRSGGADRTAALLQVYDKVLHDFDGQTLGVVISGGRDTGHSASLALPEERVRELNPPWSEEKMGHLLADLDQGRIDLFPHTVQRGFQLSWVYVRSGNELTVHDFGRSSAEFRRYGGTVYRLASTSDRGEESGTRADGGTVSLAYVFREVFDNLENAYRLLIRIPNPKQKRVEREIRVRSGAGAVKTQTFFRPSSSLRENIERYLSSISKERRMRAAYAARDYSLDDRIYLRVEEWLPDEPSDQVRQILEESKLLMNFKRGQAPDRSVRRLVFEALYSTPPARVDETNRQLLATLRELVARIMSDNPDAYGGEERVRRILRPDSRAAE